jgi:hypothetical protein
MAVMNGFGKIVPVQRDCDRLFFVAVNYGRDFVLLADTVGRLAAGVLASFRF